MGSPASASWWFVALPESAIFSWSLVTSSAFSFGRRVVGVALSACKLDQHHWWVTSASASAAYLLAASSASTGIISINRHHHPASSASSASTGIISTSRLDVGTMAASSVESLTPALPNWGPVAGRQHSSSSLSSSHSTCY